MDRNVRRAAAVVAAAGQRIDPEAIRADLQHGLVSAAAAARDYGWENGR